jgi:hypothetical protein|tara:strand:- start:52 stop:825 length:774 start_codon:yes stop_codon:yes gene_type:complete
MGYLGRGLDRGNYLKLDDLASQFDGSTVTFNLTTGGQAFYPGSAFSILVSLAGIIQEPESAYIITNNTITFASPPQVGDDYFCIALGVPLAIGVPGQGTVNSTHIQNNSISFESLETGARGVGIQSAGVSIAGAGVTQLNFIGVGNTFKYDSVTNTIDISISGNLGAGGTWASNTVGVHTSKIVGVNTTTIVGSANSEGALQVNGNVAIIEGALLTDKNIEGEIFVPNDKNALLIGPVTVGAAATIDVAVGSVLVIV